MDLNINYTGDLGSGEISISLSEKATIEEFITEFHKKSNISETYKIMGGAPPRRKSITVRYNYRINNKQILRNGLNDQISTLDITDNGTVLLDISGGGKVD